MTGKIFRSTVFVAVVVLICSLSIILGVLYGYFNDVQIAQLRDELGLAAIGTEADGLRYLEKIDSDDLRITWVDPEGGVIYDTHADTDRMENHADREEIREALEQGRGSAVRQSDTILERSVYEAVRLADGSVLRISMDQQTMTLLLLGMLRPMCLVLLIAVVLCGVLSGRMSRRVMEPLNGLDLEHPLENDTYEELAPLLSRIHQQHEQIRSQLRSLQRKTDEFDQATHYMREGLVLLDKNGVILSINPAAMALFGGDGTCIGRPFYELDRRSDMAQAAESALEKGHEKTRGQRNGREYKFLFDRIESGDRIIGLVLLAIDVTEQENAERTRREFSANVSHELKTPLQAIIGSAELLESGLVRPEDEGRFLSQIHREASRLVLLIDDVIRLSHLDEGVEVPREEVELLAVAEETAGTLQLAAEKKGVTIRVSGEACPVRGVRRMLGEIVENLCSNAVKYNVEGGSVDVTVRREGEHTVLTVADTGIGIPAEHQSRVFERFYRVDKSHSRQTGGTGLGLSIVKHAAHYHNAKVSLQSAPGQGTTVMVTF